MGHTAAVGLKNYPLTLPRSSDEHDYQRSLGKVHISRLSEKHNSIAAHSINLSSSGPSSSQAFLIRTSIPGVSAALQVLTSRLCRPDSSQDLR